MIRNALLFGALLTTTYAAVGADTKLEPDLAALQGNWKPLQIECQGQPFANADQMKQMTGVYDNSEYFLYFVDRNKSGEPDVMLVAKAKVTLDPMSSPKSITFELAEGPLKGKRQHGIYEITGNQLRLCYCPADKPKPTEFKSAPGMSCILETWARQVK
jgi:uncharacterized protein (TIGR03067 family)